MAIAILSVALGHIDDWTFELGNLVNDYVIDELDTDPRETHTRFGELIANPADEDDGRPWYKKLFDVKTAVAKAIGYFFIWLAAKVAWIIVWWAHFIHKALGLLSGWRWHRSSCRYLMLNATRGIAVRYCLGLLLRYCSCGRLAGRWPTS